MGQSERRRPRDEGAVHVRVRIQSSPGVPRRGHTHRQPVRIHPRNYFLRNNIFNNEKNSSKIRFSATIGSGMLTDNRRWRLMERGGESRPTVFRKCLPMVLMADNQSGG